MMPAFVSPHLPETTGFSVGWIADAVGGRIVRGSPNDMAIGVQTDTRKPLEDTLFCALRGPNHDAHNYLAQATAAAGFLVDEPGLAKYELPVGKNFVIAVPDTTEALLDLARAYLKKMNPRVVAVTGSAGKTTTKDLIATLLSGQRVHATIGNFNNRIGLPLSILSAPPDTEFFVAELGISEPGEMDELAELVTPEVSILTHVAAAHLEGLKSVDIIVREKGRIFAHMQSDCPTTAIIPVDLPAAGHTYAAQASRIWQFTSPGTEETGEAYADSLQWNGRAYTGQVRIGTDTIDVTLPLPGLHNVKNLLAALLAVRALGIEPNLEALESFLPSGHRSQLVELGPIRILDDCYNANPDSVIAALETAIAIARPGQAHAVLGSMLELGDASESLHSDVGSKAAELGIASLVGFRTFGEHTIEGAKSTNANLATLISSDPSQSALFAINQAAPGDVILLKGSRGSRTEEVLEACSSILNPAQED